MAIRKLIFFLIGLLSLFYFDIAYASPWGLSYSYLLISDDPSNVKGWRAAVTYQPANFNWEHLQIYFDAGYGYWRTNSATCEKQLSTYSVAPYFRYYWIKTCKISPYVEASIGLSYLSRTRFARKNDGEHFAFQDQIGVGAAFGAERRFYATLTGMHYSNGSLSSNNSGITIPLLLTIGYRF